VDRAAEWGLSFSYSNGDTGQLYYPEIVGGGAALFDYDNDGDLDVFLTQGRVLEPGKAESDPVAMRGGRLFRNDLIAGTTRNPAPRFVDVTEASGIRANGYGMGVAAGDFDNDGWTDLYLANFGSNQLWRNRGDGTFADVTRAAGADDPQMSLSASFFDFDRDGWLDLFIADYVEFSVEHNVVCYAKSSRRDYCGPSSFPAVPSRLLHNRRDGTFEDVSLASGIAKKAGRGMGVAAADFDGDGWQDVLVANDGMANFLWRNRGNGMFEEVALESGVAVNAEGKAEANMGVAVADYDNDGDEDLFVTHLDGETNTLWVNQGAGVFEDRTAMTGLGPPSLPFTGFGTAWLDYDNDGALDLLAVDGAVAYLEDRVRQGDPFPYAQRHLLFHNLGNGRFAETGRDAGEPFNRPGVGRGAAFGDVDNDGDTDVLVVQCNGPALLLVNQRGSSRPWLGLRLTGRPQGAKAERDLFGARAEIVRRGAPPLWRRAASDGSYASANDPRVLVGLGATPEIVEVTEVKVHWPGGAVESFPAPPLRTYTTLVQGQGRAGGAR
jgi:hypothetical protein